MTKRIRVENADTSKYEAIVEIWQKQVDGDLPDELIKTVNLKYPADLTECYIHSHQYLVIKEIC